jgi:hypothetical protein
MMTSRPRSKGMVTMKIWSGRWTVVLLDGTPLVRAWAGGMAVDATHHNPNDTNDTNDTVMQVPTNRWPARGAPPP